MCVKKEFPLRWFYLSHVLNIKHVRIKSLTNVSKWKKGMKAHNMNFKSYHHLLKFQTFPMYMTNRYKRMWKTLGIPNSHIFLDANVTKTFLIL